MTNGKVVSTKKVRITHRTKKVDYGLAILVLKEAVIRRYEIDGWSMGVDYRNKQHGILKEISQLKSAIKLLKGGKKHV